MKYAGTGIRGRAKIGIGMLCGGLLMASGSCGGGSGSTARGLKSIRVQYKVPNSHGAVSRFYAHVEIPGAGTTFPAGASSTRAWIGTPTPVVGSPNWFLICWNGVSFPNTFDVTVTFAGPTDIGLRKTWTQDTLGGTKDVPIGDLKITKTYSVVCSNPSTNDDALIYARSQYALVAAPITPDHFVDGDPIIEALEWHALSATPFTLLPGQSATFPVPPEVIVPGAYILSRFTIEQATEPGSPMESYTLFLVPAPPIPAVSTWGLIVLAILLAVAATIVVRRVRPSTAAA